MYANVAKANEIVELKMLETAKIVVAATSRLRRISLALVNVAVEAKKMVELTRV